MSAELELEPVLGLPHELPPGERILWQGRPRWKGLARYTFRLPWLCVYFACIILARGFFVVPKGAGAGDVAMAIGPVLMLAALCLGLLTLLAWLNARATIYTLTTRRVVMRIGVTFSVTYNLPFKRLAAANLVVRGNGDGDIALELLPPDRIAWLHLWPHAQSWHFSRARPMLRSIPDAQQVSAMLADAIRAWSVTEGASVFTVHQESSELQKPLRSLKANAGM